MKARIIIFMYALLTAVGGLQAQDKPWQEVASFQIHQSCALPEPHNLLLAFSPDGKYLAVGASVISTTDLAHFGPLSRKDPRSQMIVFHPDSRQFASYGGGTATLWKIDAHPTADSVPFVDGSNEENPHYRRLHSLVSSGTTRNLIFNARGDEFLTVQDANVLRGDVKTGQKHDTSFEHGLPATLLGYFLTAVPQTDYLVFVPVNGNTALAHWDGRSLLPRMMIEPPYPYAKGGRSGGDRTQLAVASNGKYVYELVKVSSEGAVYQWDVAKGKVIFYSPPVTRATAICALGNDGNYALGYDDGRIEVRNRQHKVVDVLRAGRLRPYDLKAEGISAIAASPDGEQLAVYLRNRECLLFQRGGTPVTTSIAHPYWPMKVGDSWHYHCAKEGIQHVALATGTSIVGKFKCVRLEWYKWSKGKQKERPYLCQFWTQDDGQVKLVAELSSYYDYDAFYHPALPIMPADMKEGSQSYQFASNARGRVETRLRLASERRGTLDTVRLEVSKFGPNLNPTAMWFAKGIGLVRWEDTKRQRILELQPARPRK